MTAKAGLLAALLLSLACGGEEPQQSRAARLAGEALKMVRLEQQAAVRGATLSGVAAAADSLFIRLVTGTDPECITEYARTGSGPCLGRIDSFLTIAGDLVSPRGRRDPATSISVILKGAPECAGHTDSLLEAYAAAFMQNMDEKRDIGYRLDLVSFALALGAPVTLRDLGLEGADTTRLQEIAGNASKLCGNRYYGTTPFDFYLALVRLDDLGGRFGHQQDAAGMAKLLMQRAEFKPLLPGLQTLKPLRIVFFGDSQMDSRHWSSPAHYPDIIAAVFREVNPGMEVFNAGKGGDDSGEGLARLDEAIAARKPELCFIMFGGNDCAHWGRPNPSVSPEQFELNVAGIVSRLGSLGCRSVLMSYPAIPELTVADNEVLSRMNSRLAALKDSLSTGWLDVRALVDGGNPRRMFAPDGIHYSPEAHYLISLKVLEYLSRGAL